MLPQLINMLTWWQWLILAAVPPAIIALYFLKLKRRPLVVPSTYLWHRSIEDLHVNTIWQRLRRNLLLFLQLLLIFLAMLAVLRPGWRGSKVSGNRFIFVIDNSASMQATDSGPSRLAAAKRQAEAMIDQMTARDVGMIVSSADTARIEQMFTHNRRSLRKSLEAIRPTQRATSLSEALKVASGLANPGRSAEDATDVQVADPLPATLCVFSDGNFPDVSDFRLGNLDPVYMPIGTEEAANVGILAFNVRRSESDPTLSQAFARLENFGRTQASVSVELRLDGRTIDADELQIPSGESRRVAFELGHIDSGVLELRASTRDHLTCDDAAWTVVNPPQKSELLIVTPGNNVLAHAFAAPTVLELAEVTLESPDFLEQKQYEQQAAVGAYDLVIYDRCQPKQMPQANTLFIGAIPPAERGEGEDAGQTGPAAEDPDAQAAGWRAGPKVPVPAIIDTNASHPLMQWIDMVQVDLAEGTPLEMPPGGTVLVDSHAGPMFAVAPRASFQDAVMGFVLVGERVGDQGTRERYIGTNWWLRGSFPVFVLNLLEYLGGDRTASGAAPVRPGQPVTLENPDPRSPLEVRTPAGETIALKEESPGKYTFTGTTELGVYDVLCGGQAVQRFAVNLFDRSESNIPTSQNIKIGRGSPIKGEASGSDITRRELWKWLLLFGLTVLLVEWYIYHRRVYL